MSEDARFEDGSDRPLRLMAEDSEDLQVISSLTQDAVFPVGEMGWEPGKRRFAVLLNRFRWEDVTQSSQRRRAFERVRSLLVIDDVEKVRTMGVDRGDPDLVLSLLSLNWEAGEDAAGRLEMVLAGDGAVSLEVECLNVTLQDVTQNYAAPSQKMPEHPG